MDITGMVTHTLEVGKDDTMQLVVLLLILIAAAINKYFFHNSKFPTINGWLDVFFPRTEDKKDHDDQEREDQERDTQ